MLLISAPEHVLIFDCSYDTLEYAKKYVAFSKGIDVGSNLASENKIKS